MPSIEWTKENLLKTYELREEGKDFSEIGEVVGKSAKAVASRYGRTDWDAFIEDPEEYIKGCGGSKIWTSGEMIQLEAYLQSGKSYGFIAEKLDRGITSVERKAQTTDWKAWKKTFEEISEPDEDGIDSSHLVEALLQLSRHDLERLGDTSKEAFLSKINLEESQLSVPFNDIKKEVNLRLIERGFANPENIKFGEGTYVVVGDSHGKETKQNLFELMLRVNKVLKPDKIIHVGHILDDDNDISYNWGKFKNLIVVAKVEELKMIQEQRNKFKFSYDVVRGEISLGNNLTVFNQDLITDYVKTPLSNLDVEIMDENSITNCHRMEFHPRTQNEDPCYVASPGCLCEEHSVKTIRQIDFKDGRTVKIKEVYHDGSQKYRRQDTMSKYWSKGLLVVLVNAKGAHTLIPCPIEETSKGYTISYFDKMIASKGVYKPTKKIFVNADMHSNKHDVNILDIQEKVCEDYKPDVLVNLGDAHNFGALNHHVMGRGIPIKEKILDEAAETHYLLKRMAKWAKESYILYGNHERFSKDFTDKFPQFGQYLDFEFLCDVKSLGYKTVKLKEVLKIGPTKFVHGEMIMYGATGSKLEKISRTFKGVTFTGHIHYPAIRFKCYSVGLSGKLDQDYNEPSATRWMHGFAMCNHFEGKSFPTSIAVANGSCMLNGKEYKAKDTSSWHMNKYKVKLSYDVGD